MNLHDLMEIQALIYMVDLPNRKERTIDLFLKTNPTLVNRVTTLMPLTLVIDNSIVFVDVDTRAAIQQKHPQSYKSTELNQKYVLIFSKMACIKIVVTNECSLLGALQMKRC